MATGRRMRGWSRLMVAASAAPLNYLRWIRQGEMRALANFRRRHPRAGDAPSVIVLLLDKVGHSNALTITVRSVRGALDAARVYSGSEAEGVPAGLPQRNLRAALIALAERHPGAWLLPLFAGDEVSPALGDILARLSSEGDAALVYWDEDRLCTGRREDPWVKPHWDPLLFGAIGGLVGASALPIDVAIQSIDAVEDSPIEPISVHRLLFRIAERKTPKHIPLILTHRGLDGRLNLLPASASSPPTWPSVSIIVPTRDKAELLAACLEGIARTDYPGPIQTIIVDNGSREPAALELIRRSVEDPSTLAIRDEGEFNFSKLNNAAAAVADGDVLCLLNNDVEPISPAWLTELVRFAVQDNVGAVGAQLLYPSGRIQHAGVAIGIGGAAGHVQKGVDPADERFWTWHAVTREVSAVTAAVMVVRKSVFAEVGGFDEDFAVAFNDVDFCLRLKERGLRNIYVAEVRLLHRESESRGNDRSPVQARRFAGELARLQARWGTEDYSDPHFSPLFSRLVERCVLAP